MFKGTLKRKKIEKKETEVKKEKKSKLRIGKIFKMFSPLSSKNKVRRHFCGFSVATAEIHNALLLGKFFFPLFSWHKSRFSESTVKKNTVEKLSHLTTNFTLYFQLSVQYGWWQK